MPVALSVRPEAKPIRATQYSFWILLVGLCNYSGETGNPTKIGGCCRLGKRRRHMSRSRASSSCMMSLPCSPRCPRLGAERGREDQGAGVRLKLDAAVICKNLSPRASIRDSFRPSRLRLLAGLAGVVWLVLGPTA